MKRLTLFFLLSFTFCLTPSLTFAQDDSSADETVRLLSTIGILTTTTTVVYFLESLSDRLLDKMFANVAQYLRHNHVAVQQDVSLGAGKTLEDLATLFRLNAPQKALMLRRARYQRVRLIGLLNQDKIDAKVARQFSMLMLGHATKAQP